MSCRAGAVSLVLLLVACAASQPASTPSGVTRRVAPDQQSGEAHAHHHAHSAHHRFRDAASWAKVFDDPARDAWQRPDDVIRELALAPDAVVVDLGAGTGYFSVRLARAVPGGRVVAVDVEQELLDWLAKRAVREGLHNVETVLAAPDDPHVAGSVDMVLVVDTYHHLSSRPAYFRALAAHLSQRGRVAIVDFRMGSIPVGPPEEMRVAPATVEAEMREAGLTRCKSHEGLPYQYLLVFGASCQD